MRFLKMVTGDSYLLPFKEVCVESANQNMVYYRDISKETIQK